MQSQLDVLAIGDINIDLVFTGLTKLPVSGREVMAENCYITIGGSTGNCAVNLKFLGLNVAMLTQVGKDYYGELIVHDLKKYGVDTSLVMMNDHLKTGITVSLNTKTDRAMTTYLGTIDTLSNEALDVSILKQARHIHVGSYFLQKKLRPYLYKIFSLANSLGITTSLDTGWDDSSDWDYGIREVLQYCDLFLPNESEACSISGKAARIEAAKYLAEFAKTVVVKCGPDGAIAVRGQDVTASSAYNLYEPIDYTGSGDAFNAGFIYAFLNGYNLEMCLKYGNVCGAICISKIGGTLSCPSLEDVELILNAKK